MLKCFHIHTHNQTVKVTHLELDKALERAVLDARIDPADIIAVEEYAR